MSMYSPVQATDCCFFKVLARHDDPFDGSGIWPGDCPKKTVVAVFVAV